MSEWSIPFYFFIIGAAMLLTVLGLLLTAILPYLERWSKRFFFSYFFVLMICCIASIFDIIFLRYYHSPSLSNALLFFEILFLSFPFPMLTAYLVHCLKKDLRKSKLFHLVTGLWFVFFILLGSTFFTDFIYYSESNYDFHRGPWFPLLLLPIIIISILNFAATVYSRKQLSRKYFYSFLIASLPMTAALVIHSFTDVTLLVDISTVLSAISMFGLILSAQIEDHLRQQQEIAQQKASINVLQMRPHFIYNTMMSIYYLIAQDTEKAQKITLDFSTYLRKNFTALAKNESIAFTEELEHTRAYLAVEQTRFEDDLFVEFDTPHIRFRIPPLTLQPIVENAIKHGLDPELNPLHVKVKTRLTENASEITVEDTGPGFAANRNDEPHIALANVKERLEMMCGGTLTIAPREGGGTVVTVLIPNNFNKTGD